MSTLNEIMEGASQLPLYDAAYELWSRKRELDLLTSPPAKPRRADLSDPEIFKRTVQEAIASVARERATAHEGPMLDWLKRAHPEASTPDLKRAIQAAVKLDTDCTRFFSYSNEGYSSDVNRAINLAKKENPGFEERTYDSAGFRLATAMR